MKYLSLFSGIGGFEHGIQKTIPDAECIGYSEIDRHAIQIYQRHYPDHKNYGDTTKIDPKTLPDFDMLCGGFPCQSFSVAGKRQGFKDTRGTLFFEICRIASEKRPRMLFLENVKGLLNHDEGQTFQRIIITMDELGYDVEWQVFNSKNFGVPQNRERVFIIGHLRTKPLCRRQIFPLGESDTRDTLAQTTTQGERTRIRGNHPHLRVGGGNNKALVAEALQERDYKGGQLIMQQKYGEEPFFPISPTLTSTESKETYVIRHPLKYLNRNQVNIEGDYSYTVDGANTGRVIIHSLQPRSPDRPSLQYSSGGSGHLQREDGNTYCLDSGNCQAEQLGMSSIRRLTPVECERLQGFPDGWTEGISDTQRYKCLGNAVTTNVIETITMKIKEVMI